MANPSKEKKGSPAKSKDEKSRNAAQLAELGKPWISMRTGLIIIAITSVIMAILTASQAIPSKGWLEGIFWGIVFGALVWVIFFGNFLINKLLRRK